MTAAAPSPTRTVDLTPYVDRVKAGVAWLDERMPDWRDRIDVGSFDIQSGCACILGQLYAEVANGDLDYDGTGFDWATEHLGVPDEFAWARRHGFLWLSRSEPLSLQDEVRVLQEMWLDEITRDRA